MGRPISGVIWFFTLDLFGNGWIYDLLTLNDQIAEVNQTRLERFQWEPIPAPYSIGRYNGTVYIISETG